MAEKRVYEVIFIVDPDTQEDDMTKLTQNLSGVITDQGGVVTRNEVLGRRHLAYRIGRKNEGVYVLFEVEGTGGEIAELERRMRVNDAIMRYMTVRVDEERQRAEKLRARRQRKAAKRPGSAAAASGGGSSARPGGGGDGGA
ncbi:MAG TPA: 30S ribosomal protein S6 [Pyrinomonadaceae bacterium]